MMVINRLTVVAAERRRDADRLRSTRTPGRQRARRPHQVLPQTRRRVVLAVLVVTTAHVRTDTPSGVVSTTRRTLTPDTHRPNVASTKPSHVQQL